GLATIADLVPLEGCNRPLVRFGLRALGRTGNVGLRALLEVCELIDPALPASEGPPIASGRVGFVLAPRINAAGRVGETADALQLLLTEDREEALRLARLLDDLNRARREEDRRTLDEALAQLEATYDPARDHGVVLAGEGWHPGVIGIVASRVVERIHRPTILIALDGERGRGSARSIPGFHLHDALVTLADRLGRFGGHAQAAGLEIERDRLRDLREGFNAVARARLEGRDLRPRTRIDLELDAASATLELADRAQWLGPHGIGNPRPVFLSRGVRVAEARELRGGHLKVGVAVGRARLDGIGFGLAERVDTAKLAGSDVDLVFHLTVNEWKGRRSPQMTLLDIRPSGEEIEREG
ncbi:MAG: DHHA1 domain-containing protein, partial [Longimicrobiales bacterium]|nr:DHHA1 domain-containing protein [Longimicrobiales bacterium]